MGVEHFTEIYARITSSHYRRQSTSPAVRFGSVCEHTVDSFADNDILITILYFVGAQPWTIYRFINQTLAQCLSPPEFQGFARSMHDWARITCATYFRKRRTMPANITHDGDHKNNRLSRAGGCFVRCIIPSVEQKRIAERRNKNNLYIRTRWIISGLKEKYYTNANKKRSFDSRWK